MSNNDKANAALRQMAGLRPPAPVADAPARKVPPANAGAGHNYVSPRRPDMNQWLRQSAIGRSKAEFITVTGESR